MNKQKNVPELRFPEFEGDWNEFKLSKLIRLISGQHLTPNEYSTENGEVPYFTGPSDFTNDSSKIKKWTVSSDKYAQKGDILITVKGNGVGEMLFLELARVIMGRQLMAIRPVKAVGEIIYQFLFTHKQKLQVLASGNVIPGLSRSDILNIKIHFSTLEEQEKIASFLSAVDKKLTQLRRKKELLETYKRGLMQKLFSQQIRFKQDDGTAFSDWQEKSLGEFLKEHQERVLANTHLPIYSSSREGLKPQKEYFADRELINEGEYGVVPHGFFVYRHMSDDLTFKFNINETGNQIAVSKEYPVFTTKKLNSRFLLHKLNYGEDFKKFAITQKRGGTRTRLYYKNLSAWKTFIPTLEEQEKIADCLTALDKKIEAVAQQIHHTEQFKKGLLQKMFV